MLYDEIADPGALSPSDLRAQYESELAAVVRDVGVETVVERSDVEREAVEALAADESPGLTLAEAADILATSEETRSAADVLLEVRDHLLLGMTTAVLDVDAIAADIDADLTAKEIQQKVEGRAPMTLAEYALLHHFIATRRP